MKLTRRTSTAVAALVAAMLVVACGGGGGDNDSDGDSGTRTLTVLAAASLTDAFDEIADVFEDENDGVEVRASYDSSSVLAEQINQGSPADVFATADERTMQSAVDEDNIDGEPAPFATNTLVIVTPPDNPAGITGLADLEGSKYAVCVADAPCGAASISLFEANGLELAPTTEEENVRGVLTKVTLGEVDAGLVYRSDSVAAAEDVTTVEAEKADEIVNNYPIGVVAESEHSDDAKAFMDLVLSDEGQQILEEYGFGPATS